MDMGAWAGAGAGSGVGCGLGCATGWGACCWCGVEGRIGEETTFGCSVDGPKPLSAQFAAHDSADGSPLVVGLRMPFVTGTPGT